LNFFLISATPCLLISESSSPIRWPACQDISLERGYYHHRILHSSPIIKMADREQPYDPYIPSASNNADGSATHNGNERTTVLQDTIKSTVDVMRDNITKVSQRGEQLDSLQDKTDNLAVSAQGFRRGANRVRKQMWWKDMKMRVCLIIAVIVLILIIVIPSVTLTRH